MSREEVHKLLGGYATGTLTPEEREALFAAALEDQELFDALMREQPLHDLLREPGAKTRLLAALEDRPTFWQRVWWRPAAGVVLMAAIGVFVVIVFRGGHTMTPVLEVAQVRQAEPGVGPPPAVSDKPAPPPVKPKAKVFHAPPQPTADLRQDPQVVPPPEVVSPKLDAQPLPMPSAQPKALGFREEKAGALVGGVLGGVPATPAADARAMFYSRGDLAKDPASESRRARISANAITMQSAEKTSAMRLGVRYTLLRRQEDGTFTAAEIDDLKKGDVVKIRFQPNESGYLSVNAVNASGPPRVIASGFVAQMAEFTTPVLKPEVTELRVTFSRTSQTGAAANAGTIVETSSDTSQRATYVVGGPNNGQFVSFPITLSYR